jgi:hypothetical protein
MPGPKPGFHSLSRTCARGDPILSPDGIDRRTLVESSDSLNVISRLLEYAAGVSMLRFGLDRNPNFSADCWYFVVFRGERARAFWSSSS